MSRWVSTMRERRSAFSDLMRRLIGSTRRRLEGFFKDGARTRCAGSEPAVGFVVGRWRILPPCGPLGGRGRLAHLALPRRAVAEHLGDRAGIARRAAALARGAALRPLPLEVLGRGVRRL